MVVEGEESSASEEAVGCQVITPCIDREMNERRMILVMHLVECNTLWLKWISIDPLALV